MFTKVVKRITKLFLALTLAGFTAGAVWLLANNFSVLNVQTGSMRPAIEPGAVVAVARVPANNLAIGDVVTFMPNGANQTVTHRIIELPSEGQPNFVTKGDANDSADEPISASQIMGRVKYSLPFIGYGINFVHQPAGLIAVIYLPALIILFSELKRLSKHYKSRQPYILPSYEPRHVPRLTSGKLFGAKLMVGLSVTTLLVGAPVWAALTDTATLSGNTISINVPDDDDNCPSGNSNTNVNVSNSTHQTATSGNATDFNNTSGGSATSGSASNSNNTSINIQINNC